MKNAITVQTVVNVPMEKVWECWNRPEHITGWAFASDDWEALASENDLRVGGRFKTTMAAKDEREFRFWRRLYQCQRVWIDRIRQDDGLHVKVEFALSPQGVKITGICELENENPENIQRSGWPALLNNFKKYAEAN